MSKPDGRPLLLGRNTGPLYARVAAALRRELADGRFRGVDSLPSEAELVQILGVSRPTLREALSILEREGLVRRVHGVGTIVTRDRPLPLGPGQERLFSFTEYVSHFGRSAGTERARLRWQRAGARVGRLLNIAPEMPVALLERLRTADGKPVMLSLDRLPETVVGADFSLDRMGESLFEYLRRYRSVQLAFSELVIHPRVAGEGLARLLDLKQGRPVLAIEETYFGRCRRPPSDEGERPLFWSLNIYRPDRWVFRVLRRS